MTVQTLVLPYQRTSPINPPRRDLVLSASDCLYLRVSVIESDDPSAKAIELSGGDNGPVCRLFIFADTRRGWGWDYGAPAIGPGTVLGCWDGVIADAIGSFDIDVESGAFAGYPLRCGWSIQLDWDGGTHTEVLAEGSVHFRRSARRLQAPIFVLSEGDEFVLS